jgi:hypothetical protein
VNPSATAPSGTARKADYEGYETPEALVTDPKLSAAQKLARLEAWEEDLKAGLRASDESMTSTTPGLGGALLQRVMACLEQLRSAAKPDGEPAA